VSVSSKVLTAGFTSGPVDNVPGSVKQARFLKGTAFLIESSYSVRSYDTKFFFTIGRGKQLHACFGLIKPPVETELAGRRRGYSLNQEPLKDISQLGQF